MSRILNDKEFQERFWISKYPHIIPYVVICDTENPSYSQVSRRLLAEPMPSTRILPQSLLQLVCPYDYLRLRHKRYQLPGYLIHYINEDYLPEMLNDEGYRPYQFAVVYVHSVKAAKTNFCEKLTERAIICACSKDVEKEIKANWKIRVQDAFADTTNDLIALLEKEAEKVLHRQAVVPVGAGRAAFRFRKPDFKVLDNNFYNAAQLLGGRKFKVELEKLDKKSRGNAIAGACESADKLFRSVFPYSSLILTVPGLNRRIATEMKEHLRSIPGEAGVLAGKIRKLMNFSQEPAGYIWQTSIEDDVKSEDNDKNVSAAYYIASERARLCEVLDNLSYLHSSFKFSVCARTPFVADALDAKLRCFSPESASRIKKTNWKKQIVEFGSELAKTVPRNLLDWIAREEREVVAISDLPVEWLSIDGIPLSLIQDVCRIPQTTPESIMAQYVRNTQGSLVLPRDISSKILFVCTAPEDGGILKACKALERSMDGKVKFAYCSTKTELKRTISESDPYVLIYFTHGVPRSGPADSAIVLGDGVLTGQEIIDEKLSAPIVLLMACSTAPVYGYLNPIAQAFFEAGASVVTSSTNPISIRFGAYFAKILVEILQYASENSTFPNYLSVLSHAVRVSVFDSKFYRLRKSQKLKDKISNDAKMAEVFLEWTKLTLKFPERKLAISRINEYILSGLAEEYRPAAKNILELEDADLEGLFLTHWGRADMVTFDVGYIR